MTFEEAFPYTFKNLRKKFGIHEPTKLSMVELCAWHGQPFALELRSLATEGTQEEPYLLTDEQLRHAAARYHLGISRSGKPIYWMIDDLGIVRDGRIGDGWVSQMLKHRYPEFSKYMTAQHCLFGLHLINESDSIYTVSIVESERSALILSELYPQSLWMAYSYPANFNEYLFAPLQGHRIILFPNADETMSTYLAFLDIADRAQRKYHLDITVSALLEDETTASQKSRHIDLLTFYLESILNSGTFQPE